jgi:hypothetical protein
MEEKELEELKVKEGEETIPVIVLTGTNEEWEKFCMLTGRNRETALAVKQGYQIPMYPDLAIVHYGDFWLNGAYDTPEYRDRIFKVKLSKLNEATNK